MINKKNRGFALLNILLGTMLLVGVIVLIMQTMSHFNSRQKYRALGTDFAPIVETLLTNTYTTTSAVTYSKGTLCTTSHPLAAAPTGYLQTLTQSGFDLCTNATLTVSIQ